MRRRYTRKEQPCPSNFFLQTKWGFEPFSGLLIRCDKFSPSHLSFTIVVFHYNDNSCIIDETVKGGSHSWEIWSLFVKREEHVETPKHESDVAFFALNSNVQWPGTRGLVLVDLFRGGPLANNVLVPLDQSQPLHLTLTVDGVLPVPISLPWISISATCIAMNAQLLQIFGYLWSREIQIERGI